MDDVWVDGGFKGNLVELYLNVGLGCIFFNYVNLIVLCKEIGVDLEFYIFQLMLNLMQGFKYNNGQLVFMGQMIYSFYVEMVELIVQVNLDVCYLGGDV